MPLGSGLPPPVTTDLLDRGRLCGHGEAPFWVGVTLAASDRADDAIPYLRRAYTQDANWAELLLRVPPVDLLPSMELAEELVEAMRGGVGEGS